MVPVLAGSDWQTNISVQGAAEGAETAMSYNEVGADFFTVFGLPVQAGRGFRAADLKGAPKVAIVNRALLRQLGLPENSVGRRMALGAGDALDIEIVGIVADSAYNTLRGGRPAQFWLPWQQQGAQTEMHFYVRSALDPATLLPQLREAVARIDPNLPVKYLATLPDVIDSSLGGERFVGALSAALAALATVLAALGLYGVLSYTLSQRMRELGLRLALGAAPRRLRAMVLRQVARMTAIGAGVGLLGALAIGRAARAQLFGLEGHDPAVLGAATMLLVAVAIAAGFGPARRASRIEPMTA
jgi:predicted lysophospholipase L1 biosynthesis ABC-type transport system permease subunit